MPFISISLLSMLLAALPSASADHPQSVEPIKLEIDKIGEKYVFRLNGDLMIQAYQVKDIPTGEDITHEIECTITQLMGTQDYAMAVFNHGKVGRDFQIFLNLAFFKLSETTGKQSVVNSQLKSDTGEILKLNLNQFIAK